MRPTISFIIPVLNEEAVIARLLRELRCCFADSQLIVVDGGSRDGTIAAAMPLCDQLLLGAPGRARQMNLGAAVAGGDYLFFLHADTCPVAAAAAIALCLQSRPKWGFCRVQLSGGHRVFRVIEWCMNQRSSLTRIATGDQLLFVARPVFHATGGFDDIPLMEDVAYSKRLRRVAPPAIVAASVVTSSRRWEQGGVLSTVLRMWCLRLGYFLGVAPHVLWRYYYGR